METATLLYEPDIEQLADPTPTTEVLDKAETEPIADGETHRLPSIRLPLSKDTMALIMAKAEVVDTARHSGEIDAATIKLHYPDLYDLISSSEQYQTVVRECTAAGCDTEMTLALHYEASNPESAPTLTQIELCVRPVEPPASSAEEAINNLIDDEAVSASYMGSYTLTDKEIRLAAGREEWIITLPTEATTNDEIQVLRLQGLIVQLLEQGEGASEQTESAMEQAALDGEPSFTFTTSTYSVINGQVVFESTAITYTLDQMITLLEEGSTVTVNSVVGQALTLEELYARKQKQEEPIKKEETVEDIEEEDLAINESPAEKTSTEPLSANSEIKPIIEETEVVRLEETVQQTVGFFRHNEPPLPSPFTLAAEPPGQTEIKQPIQIIDVPAVVIPKSVTRPEAIRTTTVTVHQKEALPNKVVAAVQKTAGPTVVSKKPAEVKRAEAVFKSSEQTIHLTETADNDVVRDEHHPAETMERPAVAHKQREAVVHRSAAATQAARPASVIHRQRQRVVRRGKQLAATSSASDVLISSGGITVIGSSGTPASVVTRAFQLAQNDYQARRATGPLAYYLRGDQQHGYQVIYEDTVITVTENLHVAA